jgi:transposase InsO family protein
VEKTKLIHIDDIVVKFKQHVTTEVSLGWDFVEYHDNSKELLLGLDFLRELGVWDAERQVLHLELLSMDGSVSNTEDVDIEDDIENELPQVLTVEDVHTPDIPNDGDDIIYDRFDDICVGVEAEHVMMAQSSTEETVPKCVQEVHIPPDSNLRTQIEALVAEFKDIFEETLPSEGSKLKPFPIEQKIKKVIKFKARPLSPEKREKVRQQVLEWVEMGVCSSAGPEAYASPIVVVYRNGKVRVCIDLRDLNITVEIMEYPMPITKEVLQSAANHKFYGKTDLRDAYHQMLVTPESVDKTGWITPDHHMVSYRLDFGHVNGPMWFQMAMDQIFNLLITENSVVIFIDDIVHYADSEDEYLVVLRKLFETCRDARLRLKAPKCFFAQDEIEMIGYVLNKNGRRFSDSRLDAIRNIAKPKNQSELRSFLGAVNTYRDFIDHFSDICIPLYDLLKGGTQYEWTQHQDGAFTELRDRLVKGIILAEGTEPGQLVLRTDASIKGIGGVLLLRDTDENGETRERPVSFFSKAFNPTQRNWSTYEQELYAIIYCVTMTGYADLLRSRNFLVETDHRNLLWLDNYARANRKLSRWRMILMEYRFAIRHVEGKDNTVADALSRVLASEEAGKSVFQVGTVMDIGHDQWATKIHASQAKFKSEDWDTKYRVDADGFYVTGADNQPMIVIPDGDNVIIDECIRASHGSAMIGHFGVRRTVDMLVQAGIWWSKMYNDVENYIDHCLVCQKTRVFKETISPMLTTKISTPFYAICMDSITGFPETDDGNKYILVCIDMYTRWVELCAIKTLGAVECAEAIVRSIVLRHGLPVQFVFDNGSQFDNSVVHELCKVLGVNEHATTAYHPQSHGIVERINREINRHLRCLTFDFANERLWDKMLPIVMYLINHSFHSAIGTSPYAMLHGEDKSISQSILGKLLHGVNPESMYARIPNSLLLLDDEKPGDYVAKLQAAIQTIHRQAAKVQDTVVRKRLDRYNATEPTEFDVGELVLLVPAVKRSKLAPIYDGPFKIIEKLSAVTFVVQAIIDPARVEQVHMERVRKLLLPEDVTQEELLNLQAKDFGESVIQEILGFEPNDLIDVRQNKDALRFRVKWLDGDVTMEPYENVRESAVLGRFLENEPDLKVLLPAGKKRGRPKKKV